jgi:hypothetical protein
MPILRVALPIGGAVLLLAALHDLFQTLFHPAARGAISDWLAEAVWNVVRWFARRKAGSLRVAGPLALVSIILSWTALVIFGCALIYYPYLSTHFTLAPGVNPRHQLTFLDALAVSTSSLITLTGYLTSRSRLLQLLMGGEAVIGFALLTASVSWLLSIYPVLQRRRSLAHMATLLHHAEFTTGLAVLGLPATDAQDILLACATQVTELRNDLTQFPITYYFTASEKITALAGILPYLAHMADEAARPFRPPAVRIAGIVLGGAVRDYLLHVGPVFLNLHHADPGLIMRRYAEDHLFKPVDLPLTAERRAG